MCQRKADVERGVTPMNHFVVKQDQPPLRNEDVLWTVIAMHQGEPDGGSFSNQVREKGRGRRMAYSSDGMAPGGAMRLSQARASASCWLRRGSLGQSVATRNLGRACLSTNAPPPGRSTRTTRFEIPPFRLVSRGLSPACTRPVWRK